MKMRRLLAFGAALAIGGISWLQAVEITLNDLGEHWMGYSEGNITGPEINIINNTGATWTDFHFWVSWQGPTGIITGSGTAGFVKPGFPGLDDGGYAGPGSAEFLGAHPSLAYGIDVYDLAIAQGASYNVRLWTFAGEKIGYYNLYGQPTTDGGNGNGGAVPDAGSTGLLMVLALALITAARRRFSG